MWYVEARVGNEYERWEGLTEAQAQAVFKDYSESGNGHVRYGAM